MIYVEDALSMNQTVEIDQARAPVPTLADSVV
jgi:hypothetical protein